MDNRKERSFASNHFKRARPGWRKHSRQIPDRLPVRILLMPHTLHSLLVMGGPPSSPFCREAAAFLAVRLAPRQAGQKVTSFIDG